MKHAYKFYSAIVKGNIMETRTWPKRGEGGGYIRLGD